MVKTTKAKITWMESYTTKFLQHLSELFLFSKWLDLMLCVCVCCSLANFTSLWTLISYGPQDSFMGLLAAVPWEGGRGWKVSIYEARYNHAPKKRDHPKKGKQSSNNVTIIFQRQTPREPLVLVGVLMFEPVCPFSADSYGRNLSKSRGFWHKSFFSGNKEKCYYCWCDNSGFTWGSLSLNIPFPQSEKGRLQGPCLGKCSWQTPRLVMFSSSKLTARPGNFGWNITFIPVKLCVFVPETSWRFDNMRNLRMKESLFQKRSVVCCLSLFVILVLQRLGIDSVQFLKLLMEEITCCNLCIKCQYKNGQPKKNVLLRWISKPTDSSCRIFVLLPRVFVLEIYGGDHFQMVMPICSWIGTHPNPQNPLLLRFFVPSGITFLALPDGIPKAKIQFLQPLGRKEGPSNMTQKNGSINEENHTVGIV